MDTSKKRSVRDHSRRVALCVVAFAVAVPLAACTSKRDVVQTTETVTNLDNHRLPPPKQIDVTIRNLHDEPAADPTQEKLVGTLVNDGDRAVDQVAIRVEALDRSGNVIRTVKTPPLSQTIEPFGGQATFETSMPQDRVVVGYRAVAIAR